MLSKLIHSTLICNLFSWMNKCRYLCSFTNILIIVCCMLCSPGCTGSKPNSELYFPVQAEPTGYMMTARLEGELWLDSHGCLRVQEWLILWPYGFSKRLEGNKIEVIDNKGHIAACVGDYLILGGGGIPAFFAEEKTGHPFPEWCGGPYFLMGKVADRKE